MFSRVLTGLLLALAIAAVPATATITYCNGGCSSTAGLNYASFETAASAFTFPAAPITFVSGGLSGAGVYTDTSGVTFTGSINASADPLAVSGTALVQTGSTINGSPRTIAIALPANTFAFAMFVTNVSGGGGPFIGLTPVSVNSDWELSTSSSGASQFFGIISDTAISTVYIGNVFPGGALKFDSFVLGTQGSEAETPEGPAFFMTGGGLVFLRKLWSLRTKQTS